MWEKKKKVHFQLKQLFESQFQGSPTQDKRYRVNKTHKGKDDPKPIFVSLPTGTVPDTVISKCVLPKWTSEWMNEPTTKWTTFSLPTKKAK